MSRRRPQDEVPTEIIVNYIVRDYKRFMEWKDELAEYTKKLEGKVKTLTDKLSVSGYTNRALHDKNIELRRKCKRLEVHIESLEEQIKEYKKSSGQE